LNCLLREERAIVTAIPGTTRDVIEDMVNINGIPVRLMDTAGVRASRSIIEKMGLERTEQAIKKADLLLWVIDGSKTYDQKNKDIWEKIKNKPIIIVINKTDLPIKAAKKYLEIINKYPTVLFSAKTGKGLDQLEQAIEQQALHNGTNQSKILIITNQRQYECLRLASKSLTKALVSIGKELSPEFIVIDLRRGLTHIGELVGEVVNEDILQMIFSKFCIGK
jgi:tRNA modification GTPase